MAPSGGSASERPQVTTVAPASSSTSVMPRPMPRAPPVTSATRPVRSIVSAMSATLPSICLVWFGHDITSELREDGIRVVTMNAPPVNALTVQGWFDVATALDEAGRDLATKVVVLRAEGKGFNAGVDIKEMQNTTGFDALLGANRGCYAAFKAVYECAVPVVAASTASASAAGWAWSATPTAS